MNLLCVMEHEERQSICHHIIEKNDCQEIQLFRDAAQHAFRLRRPGIESTSHGEKITLNRPLLNDFLKGMCSEDALAPHGEGFSVRGLNSLAKLGG